MIVLISKSPAGETTAIVKPAVTDLEILAINSFSHLLDRNSTVRPDGFAALIEDYYSIENPKIREVVDHLRRDEQWK